MTNLLIISALLILSLMIHFFKISGDDPTEHSTTLPIITFIVLLLVQGILSAL